MNTKNIFIYTDGSCIGNPGPGGWAALLLESHSGPPFKILSGHEKNTTNNRMEMLGVIEALRYIHENHLQNSEITLYSDSNLVIQTLKQGWKRKANIDLWEELDQYNEELEVNFVWVKGHAKNKWNNECDKIAQSESRKVIRSRSYDKKYIETKTTKNPHIKKTNKQSSLF